MERLYCSYTPDPGILVVSVIDRPLDNNWVVRDIPNCTFSALNELLNDGGYLVDEWIENCDLYSHPVHVAKIRRVSQ